MNKNISCSIIILSLLLIISFIPNASAVVVSGHSEVPQQCIVGTNVTLTYTLVDGAGDPNNDGYVGVQIVLPNATVETLSSQYWRLLGGADSQTIVWYYIVPELAGYYDVYYNNTKGGGSYDEVGQINAYIINYTWNITPSSAGASEAIRINYTASGTASFPTYLHVTPRIDRPDGSCYYLAMQNITVTDTYVNASWTVWQMLGGQYDVFFNETQYGFNLDTDGFFITSDWLNDPPSASAEASRTSATVGDVIDFWGVGTDSDGFIVNYTWEINGMKFYTENISHSFDEDGVYLIRFTVQDNDGGYDVDTMVVDIFDTVEELIEDEEKDFIEELKEQRHTYLLIPVILIVTAIIFLAWYGDNQNDDIYLKWDFIKEHGDGLFFIFLILALFDIGTGWITDAVINLIFIGV